MKKVRVTNTTRNVEMAGRAMLADTHWTRLRGLIGRPRLRRGEGLVIAPSRGVHTYGLQYAIDVVMLDEVGQVIALHPELQPGRRTPICRRARRVLEFSSGTIAATGTVPGDRIAVTSSAAAAGDEVAGLGRTP